MKLRYAIIALSCVVAGAIGVVAYVNHSVWSVVADQQARNQAATPLFDAVVTKRLKVGDTPEKVKQVLADAGLHFSENGEPRTLYSLYSTGNGSGIALAVKFDSNGLLASYTVQTQTTGGF
jgi:hypothetical protein